MRKPYFLLLTLLLTYGILICCKSKKDDPAPYTNPLIYGRWEYVVGLDSLWNKQNQLLSADTVDTNGKDDIYLTFHENGQAETTLDEVGSGSYRFKDAQTLEVRNSSGIPDYLPIHKLTSSELIFVITDTAYGNGNYSKQYLYFKK